MKQSLRVNEIFHSIQGESSWVGSPCVFVRLRGCPHRCHYCDTSYAFTEGSDFTFDEIVKQIDSYSTNLVQLTGGEPLAQEETIHFMKHLCDLGKTVLLETCGSLPLDLVDSRVHKIVDIKTPNSGAEESFLSSNFDFLTTNDEIKFVITNRQDFDWSMAMVVKRDLLSRVKAVHCSPVMEQAQDKYVKGCGGLDPELLAQWILGSGLQVKCHLQLHKYIWHPTTRGV